MCGRLLVLVLAGVLSAAPLAAQEAPSVGDTADRPGFADSPVLLGQGHVQLEMGFTSEHEAAGEQSLHTRIWPQVEVHAGISSRVDVSMFWDGVVSNTLTTGSDLEDSSTGAADVRVGAKLRLVHRQRFAAAFVGYVNVPVGSVAVSSRYADPAVRLAWATSITDRTGISGTADLKAVREDDDEVRVKPALSAALSSGLFRTLDGFIGFAAEPPSGGSRPTAISIETGIVLPLGERNQIDVWVSRRIAADPESWFVSAGYIRRLR